jgi:predicted nucleic acid-binding protein
LNVYADSSFLTANYLSDTHSHEVDRRMATRPSLLITPFICAELANAIYRQVFLQRIPVFDAERAWENFDLDSRSGLLEPVEFPEASWRTIVDLAVQYGPTLGVRTLDSLHVACALELKADKFWTFDERQAKLAEAVGLDVNP